MMVLMLVKFETSFPLILIILSPLLMSVFAAGELGPITFIL
jgi:hypothetical protein